MIIRTLTYSLLFLIFIFSITLASDLPSTKGQVLKNDDVKILLVTDSAYGANYNIKDARGSIRKQLNAFGWKMDIAAPFDTVMPCSVSVQYFNHKPFPADFLIGDLNIERIMQYDAIVLLPNATGQEHNYGNKHLLGLIKEASDSGIVVAGWCRAVRLMAAAGLLKGKKVVGNADYEDEYIKAGAEFLGNDHSPVIDGNIVTIVRSRYYRTEGCRAIAEAIKSRK